MELNIGNKKIEKLFAEFFGLDSNYIHQCYRKFKDAYNQQLSSSHDGFISKQKQSWKISFQEQKTENNWDNSTLIGIDLPLFFKCPDPKAQTVMLVALDPLRSRDDFSLELKGDSGVKLFNPGDPIIGTPFALHSSFYREDNDKKIRTKVYCDPIKHIVEKNYHLYVTDKYKVWMNDCEKEKESNKYKLKKEEVIFGELLLKELEIIKPNKIICFGVDPKDGAHVFCKGLLKDNDLKSELLPALLHPSGSNNNKWRSVLKTPPYDVPRKIRYLKTKIDEYLD